MSTCAWTGRDRARVHLETYLPIDYRVAKPQPTAVKDEGEKDESETEEDEDENPENEDEAISKSSVPSESGSESAAVEKPTSKQVKSVQPSATVTITSLSTGFDEQGLPSTATLTATQIVANNKWVH